jgi:dihydrofolate reductase
LAKVIVGMTISLDGFVANQNGNRLHEGRYRADLCSPDGEKDVRDGGPRLVRRQLRIQVPIFVLTHHPPSVAPKEDEHLTFTFVTDGVESAIAQAKAAARDKAVQVVGGVSIAQQLLDAGLVDELHVDIMPVFLGIGLRSFESSSLERVRLEKINVQEVGARTSLRFRVKQQFDLLG